YYFLPLYANGVMPETTEARRRELRGFVTAATYVPADEIFALLSADVQGVHAVYFPRSEDLLSNPEYTHVQQLLSDNHAHLIHYVTQNLPFTSLGVASQA